MTPYPDRVCVSRNHLQTIFQLSLPDDRVRISLLRTVWSVPFVGIVSRGAF